MVVEAAWLQTRLLPGIREDVRTYVISAANDRIVLSLPTADGPEARVFRFPEKGAPTKLLVPARWMRFLDPACKPIAVTPVEGDWVFTRSP